MIADLGSNIYTAFLSLFSNVEIQYAHIRIKIRSLVLIHSLFKGIFSFELALRFASSLVIQEASICPQILYCRGFLKIYWQETSRGKEILFQIHGLQKQCLFKQLIWQIVTGRKR